MTRALGTRRPLTDLPGPLVLACALAVAVAVVLVQQQGGLPGHRHPHHLQVLSYAVEAAAVATIALLAAPRARVAGWLLALVVGLAPFVAALLGHAGALRGDVADQGRWTEPLALTGLALDLALVVLSLAALAGTRRRRVPEQVLDPYAVEVEAPEVRLIGSWPGTGLRAADETPVKRVGPYGVEVEALDAAPIDEIRG